MPEFARPHGGLHSGVDAEATANGGMQSWMFGESQDELAAMREMESEKDVRIKPPRPPTQKPNRANPSPRPRSKRRHKPVDQIFLIGGFSKATDSAAPGELITVRAPTAPLRTGHGGGSTSRRQSARVRGPTPRGTDSRQAPESNRRRSRGPSAEHSARNSARSYRCYNAKASDVPKIWQLEAGKVQPSGRSSGNPTPASTARVRPGFDLLEAAVAWKSASSTPVGTARPPPPPRPQGFVGDWSDVDEDEKLALQEMEEYAPYAGHLKTMRMLQAVRTPRSRR